MSSDDQLKITRRTETNQYYDEVLAEGILPLRMMQVPKGTFLMGSPDDEPERNVERESPQHEVSVSEFFMAKYPVTQAQWRVVASMARVNRDLDPAPSSFKGDARPVEQVSWHDAVEFCDRLALQTNRRYRLPSEAEWEYACRAGTTTPFHCGETITTDIANYRGTDNTSFGWSGSYNNGPLGEYRQQTTLVTQFEFANAYGLCDMHGNIWEWCADQWHDNYDGAPNDSHAWIASSNSHFRVRRGGSWDDSPADCRSAFRYRYESESSVDYLGVRIVCSGP